MTFRLVVLALAFACLSLPVPAGEPPAMLETPYTAEQIRDAWREGFSIIVRTRDVDGEHFARHAVTSWSPERVALSMQPTDAAGAALGEASPMSATWEELRQHALFPAAQTTRERATRETAVGSLQGWLYRVRKDDGTEAEFFFGDTTAGMPVQFGRKRAGQWISQSEQVARTPAPSQTSPSGR